MTWHGSIPRQGSRPRVILFLSGLSVAFYLLARLAPLGQNATGQMHRASEMMAEAVNILKQCRQDVGLPQDDENDPNGTGLIGVEFSPLTTSRGNLEAKRTTTNPNFAALLVHLLREARVQEGDVIAVGASGSFPALIVATLSAAKAMNVRVLPIYSLGASQWGANEPGFTWLHMESCLQEAGWLDVEPVAFSLGGEKDVGEDWSADLRASIEEELVYRGVLLLREPDLRRNVEKRLQLYENAAEGRPVRTFINIGGSWANTGESSDILGLRPGLVEIQKVPSSDQRGVTFEMASRGIPVIHLLYVKGLVERYGLNWDPVPLPSPGEGVVYRLPRRKDPRFLVLAAVYFSLVALTLIFGDRLDNPSPR